MKESTIFISACVVFCLQAATAEGKPLPTKDPAMIEADEKWMGIMAEHATLYDGAEAKGQPQSEIAAPEAPEALSRPEAVPGGAGSKKDSSKEIGSVDSGGKGHDSSKPEKPQKDKGKSKKTPVLDALKDHALGIFTGPYLAAVMGPGLIIDGIAVSSPKEVAAGAVLGALFWSIGPVFGWPVFGIVAACAAGLGLILGADKAIDLMASLFEKLEGI
ncbi:MAG: hypothetical protein A3G41_04970 [Elusimicrobia bacterium RIFCSPLOWO2_12_FULL_59_9]|nr:MAG: hypothetical protein A3G41_04970 [Elusimicrobia bacterium RIFCSPLOWO2_12_FULL_59_9]